MIKGTVWDNYIKPSKLWGNVYFVGIRSVSTHFIDTGDAYTKKEFYEKHQMQMEL